MATQNGTTISEDEIDQAQFARALNLNDSLHATYSDLKTPKNPTRLNNIEDNLSKPADSPLFATGSSFYDGNEDTLKSAAPLIAAALDVNTIETGIKTFAESSKVLMKALDAVSQAHPFIAVAVIAFKAVITLELKRRDNDQKVVAIKLSMKDMMAVLLELRNVKDPTQKGPDGKSIQGRMQSLMEQIASDITSCGNVCDTYTKKNTIVRVLTSPIWEERLFGYIAIFEEHRDSIRFSLSIHTALGVDTANHKISMTHQAVQSTDEKVDMILLFRTLDSPHEKELMNIIQAHGGPKKCIEDDAILRKLMALHRAKGAAKSVSSKWAASDAKERFHMEAMKRAFKEDVEVALQRNSELYEKKMQVQMGQLFDDLKGAVAREGDRVITALSGPCDRILDPDLHIIWKEMGWRGSVKARHFVLALQDHFHDKYSKELDLDIISPSPAVSEAGSSEEFKDFDVSLTSALASNHAKRITHDQWALPYIDILRIQPILESFDDDASGFISVKEANAFSSSRPDGWTFTAWLAYWAAGWHCSIWDYRNKIKGIIKTMSSMLDDILPVNRGLVDMYLASYAFSRVELLLESVNAYDGAGEEELQEKMQPYTAREEARLKKTLDIVDWNIDSMDTLFLITGPGRVEKFIFPVLYLVLRQHLQIISLGRTVVFSTWDLVSPEISQASEALAFIVGAAEERINRLCAVFKSNYSSTSTQFGNVAFGMFRLMYDPSMGSDTDEDAEFIPAFWDEVLDQPDVKILKHGIYKDELDRTAYDETENHDIEQSSNVPSVSIMQGIWTGSYFYGYSDRADGLVQIDIHTSAENGTFTGGGVDGLDTFGIEGQISLSTDNTDVEVRFVKKYKHMRYEYTHTRYGEQVVWIYQGVLDTVTGTISGHWGDEEDDHAGTFRMGRAPAWSHQFRYSPSEFEENPGLARWRFVCEAVLYEVRQRLWSWRFFAHRRTRRRRFLELFRRRELTKIWYFSRDLGLTREEFSEIRLLEESFTPADARFYHSLGISELRKLCVHFNTKCDLCSSTIVGRRTTCLSCVSDDYSSLVDLCIDCSKMPVRTALFSHVPAHDMIQVGQIIHDRDKSSLLSTAKGAAIKGRLAMEDSQRKIDGGAASGPILECSWCGNSVSLLCWFCIACSTETFICEACNTSNEPGCAEGSEHAETHPLVLLKKAIVAEVNDTESRLMSLESRYMEDKKVMNERLEQLKQSLEARELAVNQRLGAFEAKVDERLKTVEELLSLIVSKLSA